MADTEVTPISVKDHGNLIGLTDDDHSQYLNTTRHDVKARHPITVLGWTADKILKGAGAALDPVETDFPDAKVNMTASDTLQQSNDTARTTSTGAYEKKKETKLNIGLTGTIRIKFDLRVVVVGAQNAVGKLYRNGVAIGTERSTASGAYQTYSEDFNCSTWEQNDLIQLYAYHQNSPTDASYVRNLQLYGELNLSGLNQD